MLCAKARGFFQPCDALRLHPSHAGPNPAAENDRISRRLPLLPDRPRAAGVAGRPLRPPCRARLSARAAARRAAAAGGAGDAGGPAGRPAGLAGDRERRHRLHRPGAARRDRPQPRRARDRSEPGRAAAAVRRPRPVGADARRHRPRSRRGSPAWARSGASGSRAPSSTGGSRRIHRPYHAALDAALGHARARFGGAILLDCHSMPPRPRGDGGDAAASVIFGDRHGTTITADLLDAAVARRAGPGLPDGVQRALCGGLCRRPARPAAARRPRAPDRARPRALPRHGPARARPRLRGRLPADRRRRPRARGAAARRRRTRSPPNKHIKRPPHVSVRRPRFREVRSRFRRSAVRRRKGGIRRR